ncbi:MAG: NAD(P)-binding domain-containing protein [Actinomycetota bacterium]
MTTIGIIGAGNIGSQIARKAVESGYDVVISNSRGPETLTELVAELGPKATAGTAVQAADAADVAVVTVPFKAFREIPVEPLAGKIVIDTNNYYFERDGRVPELDDGTSTVSGMLQEHLPTSRVAKAFNAIQAPLITEDSLPAGDPNRRALVTSSDFADASDFVTKLYDEFGFDSVNVGPLSESWRVDRDRAAYGASGNVAEMSARLAKATRIV